MHIMRYLTNDLSKLYTDKSIKYSVCAKVANRNLWDVISKGKGSSKRNSVLKDKTKAFYTKICIAYSIKIMMSRLGVI